MSDLDGTLLNDSGKLDAAGIQMLQNILEKNIPMTFASARSVFSMKEILGELPLRLPVIGSNGALLSEFSSGRHLEIIRMDGKTISGIIESGKAAGLDAVLGEHGHENSRIFYERAGNTGMQWCVEERIAAGDPRLRKIADISACGSDEIVTITFIGRREEVTDLADILKTEYPALTSILYENTYTPGWFWLTLQDGEANKGAALKRLRGRYPEYSRIVVFGDNHNDLSMFSTADYAVAVENGAADLKAEADEVIGRNSENAVLHFIAGQEKI